MSERKRITFTAIAVALVGIVTGLLLGGGLLPSQAAYQIYDERVTTETTETVVVHTHDDIPEHTHILTTEIATTEVTPHGYFHGLAPTAAAPTTAPDTTAPDTTATGTTPTGSASSPKQTTNEVIIMGSTFIPNPITVTAGTTVTWTNLESEDHTVTSYDGLFDTPLWFRDSFSFTFTEPGTYEYYCIPHEDDDMLGTVIVE